MEREQSKENDPVRLDKWLWAARFYKTRALAKAAIEGGKVRVATSRLRAKPSRIVQVGDRIVLQQGFYEKTIEVLALRSQRLSAQLAQQLYQETLESEKLREKQIVDRKLGAPIEPSVRPTKKQRRLIHQFKQQNLQ